MCAISISFAWPEPSKVPITISAPAPRVVLRRSVFAPNAISRASTRSAILARPSTSELPDSITTIWRKVSINSGFAASAMARSFSSGGAADAGETSAIPSKHRDKPNRDFLMARPPELLLEQTLAPHKSRGYKSSRSGEVPLLRQKRRHRLGKSLRRFVEHPVPGAIDHHRLRAGKMPRQHSVNCGEASRGVAAANEQRRRSDRFRLRLGERLSVLVSLAEQRKDVV